MNLQKCGACLSVSYCSKDCQVKDWKRHKSICKKIKQMNTTEESSSSASVLSMSEAVKAGATLYCDANEAIIGARKTDRCPSRALDSPNAVCTLPILLAVTGSDKAPIACNALFSAAVATSTLSARLAETFGLPAAEGTQPLHSTIAVTSQMECHRSGYDGIAKVPVITQTTFNVEAEPRYEIVLGKDWLQTVAQQSDGDVYIEFAPDKCSLRFLRKQVTHRAFGDIAEEEVRNADCITMLWGIPDLGQCVEFEL